MRRLTIGAFVMVVFVLTAGQAFGQGEGDLD